MENNIRDSDDFVKLTLKAYAILEDPPFVKSGIYCLDPIYSGWAERFDRPLIPLFTFTLTRDFIKCERENKESYSNGTRCNEPNGLAPKDGDVVKQIHNGGVDSSDVLTTYYLFKNDKWWYAVC